MSVCSALCPTFRTLAEIESGNSELTGIGLLQNPDIRVAAVGLCRALLENGECTQGPEIDASELAQLWITCGSSYYQEMAELSELVAAHGDNSSLTMRAETDPSIITDYILGTFKH